MYFLMNNCQFIGSMAQAEEGGLQNNPTTKCLYLYMVIATTCHVPAVFTDG